MIGDPRRQLEATTWAREWDAQNDVLHHLLEGIDSGTLAPASALLDWVRECRRTLADPPDPNLRKLCHRTLDKIWEAGCSILYGDLGPARQHMDAALRHVREMEEILAERRS